MNEAQIPLSHGASSNKPEKIVIHAMGEFIDQADRDYAAHEWLDKLGLSAHALICPGGIVIRCRDNNQGAYHARGHNWGSLSVEFLVPGVHTYATFLEAMQTDYVSADQMAAGVELVRGWAEAYGIPADRIVRHSDISPGRKHDPGDGFPWREFVGSVVSC